MLPFAARQPQPNSADFYRDAYYNEEEERDPYEIEMKTDFNDPYNLAGCYFGTSMITWKMISFSNVPPGPFPVCSPWT